MRLTIDKKEDALIVVDVQRDFCEGGPLPVPDGDKVVPILNEYVKKFSKAGALIVVTRDWHPPNHVSFTDYGGVWPSHCVQGTHGAEFHPSLKIPEAAMVVSKAELGKEAYSGFDAPRLGAELGASGIKRILVGGLATDYCVNSTVLDALELGFDTILLEDAVRGVDVERGDSEEAVLEMLERGARRITLSDLK